MFVLTLLADTIRIPPHLLAKPTLTSVQTEIEKRYPNKIIVDVGLVLCPYGPPVEVGDGILVPGDGGAHHQVIFQCVVFRPFVEEVLVGVVTESNESGVTVSVGGFFDHVFIPAYWMLNPSVYDESKGLWVWTPTYDDDDDEEEEEKETVEPVGNDVVKQEPGSEDDEEEPENSEGEEAEEGNRFEIEIGSEIRFKVKSVNFTRITTTMKGVQATTTSTTTTSSNTTAKPLSSTEDSGTKNGNDEEGTGVRRRSSSADLSDEAKHPAPMQIVGSICEDGLGLLSWWNTAEEEEEEEEDGMEVEDI
eukprot:CAMPEP_0201632746 /NCGR_PEP_ID=MMETSP0493-20130528/6282_1 /ASSEMBLY_ACC=CAM_ASM_000838 /TAXON_ID=420259 /ORGANISM="Thalassiosira gravida, Strain GMp14c1" /LENGTH=304 /DNA_ID=CAMNT_0048104325 /DNA_START=8 /DNA_END=922 /DNA_ORIENTATION=-